MTLIWHNGAFKDDGPVLSLHDRIRLGEGVFNTMLAVDGQVMHGRRHMEKMLRNAHFFLDDPVLPEAGDLLQTAQSLLIKNGFMTGRYAVNTILTLGPAGGGIRTPDDPDIQLMMRALPVPAEFPPVHAVIAETVRRNEGSPLSQFKCSNYGDNILALREAQQKGANEAIMLNNKGHVATSTVANIVAVLGGKLTTPPLSDGCQGGVTRGLLLERYDIAERSITPEELEKADGIYLTNSLRGPIALSSLNGQSCPPPSLEIAKDFHLE